MIQLLFRKWELILVATVLVIGWIVKVPKISVDSRFFNYLVEIIYLSEDFKGSQKIVDSGFLDYIVNS